MNLDSRTLALMGQLAKDDYAARGGWNAQRVSDSLHELNMVTQIAVGVMDFIGTEGPKREAILGVNRMLDKLEGLRQELIMGYVFTDQCVDDFMADMRK